MKSYKKSILSIIAVLFIATLFVAASNHPRVEQYFAIKNSEEEQKQIQRAIQRIQEKQEEEDQKLQNEQTPDPELQDLIQQGIVKKEAYLEVPFICQAPLETEANWKLHEESCEEAALLQAYLYETGQTVTKERANEIILDMIEWQNQNMGGHFDLYADGMVEFITGFYDINREQVKVIYDAEIKDLKQAVSSGHPVIVPITGEILQNPYYPYPGYHMLTVIGYTENTIITNDNGTRRGANFSYKIDVFEAAMKDAGGDILILELE